uniref:Uncharacterized protein n=1 Tax=Chromera velia CCMP2878 TaxID=1169474 RepID=A0A0G4HUA9_9ALVE|eukprot:Cvel_31817.t1-p1 / transcript=Cvel_31817.t1 / gene=Cvel_31817 / organism=Chromera_velia_CCMP2878 / gene_product=hypothetical protein / transcript_product=hypothetical protein / location=Cvel_scaffold4808:5138-6674(+) / protein_length=92 / sequence_SO=supercontig / SO=protein_coding / is_pseudo=false
MIRGAVPLQTETGANHTARRPAASGSNVESVGAGGGGGGRGASVGVEAVLVRPVQMETGAPPPPIFNTDGFYADLQSRLEAQREALARIAKG